MTPDFQFEIKKHFDRRELALKNKRRIEMKNKIAATFLMTLAVNSIGFAADTQVCYHKHFYGETAADKQSNLVEYGSSIGFSKTDLDRAAVPNSKGIDSHKIHVLTSKKADKNGTHTLTLADEKCRPLSGVTSTGRISDTKLSQDFSLKDRDTRDGTR